MALPDFPAVSNLGEQSKFREFGLSLESHKEPHIRLVGNEISVDIGYKPGHPVRTLAVLRSLADEKEYEDCVFINNLDKTVRFIATIPKVGFWKLEIYALPAAKDDDEKLIGVFNYVLHCSAIISKHYPYPKRFKQWSDGCQLFDPVILHKDVRGPSVHFKVRVPKADDVAVCVNNIQPWTELKKTDEDRDIWEGNVKVGDYYGSKASVTLNALYPGKGKSYSILLQYTI